MAAVVVILGGCARGAPTSRSPVAGSPTGDGTTITAVQPNGVGRAATPHQSAVDDYEATGVRGNPAGGAALRTPTVADPSTRPTTLRGHEGPVTVLAWSPDGHMLASGSSEADATGAVDSTVHLWTVAGVHRGTLAGHTGPVTSLAWSPDGRILASGSRDETVRLWNRTGDPLATLSGGDGQVHSLAWSPDGRVLAVGSIEPGGGEHSETGLSFAGLVRLINPDGEILASLSTDGGGGKFLPLGWSPGGTTLAAGARAFRLWRADGTVVATLEGGTPAPAMAWSGDGRLLATGDENGAVSLYTPTGQPVDRLVGNGTVVSLAFSPDGRMLALLSSEFVRLFDAREPRREPRLVHRSQLIPAEWSASNVAWSPNGRWLAGRPPDGALTVWRADGSAPVRLDGCGEPTEVVAWSPDGRTLAGGLSDRTVCLWSWEA